MPEWGVRVCKVTPYLATARHLRRSCGGFPPSDLLRKPLANPLRHVHHRHPSPLNRIRHRITIERHGFRAASFIRDVLDKHPRTVDPRLVAREKERIFEAPRPRLGRHRERGTSVARRMAKKLDNALVRTVLVVEFEGDAIHARARVQLHRAGEDGMRGVAIEADTRIFQYVAKG